jgi:hypothetical protein
VTRSDPLARVLSAAADAGRLAAQQDRANATRSAPVTKSTSDSRTARRIAHAWWGGYLEVWPEALSWADQIDTTGVSDADLALDREEVSDAELAEYLPGRYLDGPDRR